MTSMPGYAFILPMAHSTMDSWRGFSSFTSSPIRACEPHKHFRLLKLERLRKVASQFHQQLLNGASWAGGGCTGKHEVLSLASLGDRG